MSAKAYLIVRFNTAVMPPAVVGAEISTSPLASWTLTGRIESGWRYVELMHVKGGTYEQAAQKLLRQIQGLDPCSHGDLRFLWPFLDPSVEAYHRRYHLEGQIQATVATMPPAKPPQQPLEVAEDDAGTEF